MAKTTIEWCDYTFNHVRGCTKVSEGCANCYADSLSKRNPSTLGIWGPNGKRVVAAESYWQQPLKWNKDAEAAGERRRVFCASLADVFEDWDGEMTRGNETLVWPHAGSEVDGYWVKASDGAGDNPFVTIYDVQHRLFKLINATPHIDWLLLTKRPDRIRQRIILHNWDRLPVRNLWLGTSVENQEQADKRISELLKCRDLSPVLFLSCEPLLGPVELTTACDIPADEDGPNRIGYMVGPDDGVTGLSVTRSAALKNSIDWVICGGESGPNARPMHPEWVRSLRDQCQAADVPFLFKQWGKWTPNEDHDGPAYIEPAIPWADNGDLCPMFNVGKKAAGRLLDDREWNEFPEVAS